MWGYHFMERNVLKEMHRGNLNIAARRNPNLYLV